MFEWLSDAGDVDLNNMRRVFNCGVGGVVVVAPDAVDETLTKLSNAGEDARVIGDVTGAS